MSCANEIMKVCKSLLCFLKTVYHDIIVVRLCVCVCYLK